jgi:hypothetical protein
VRGLLLEAFALLALLTLYRLGRTLADGHHALARRDAERVWSLERFLHLPGELPLQHVLLAHPHLAQVANAYYASVHFPLTGAVLVWLFLRRRRLYGRIRTTLVFMTANGLLIAFLYPLAPPRMMTDLGFVDVAARFGQSVYQGAGESTSNQFAAMPSLHVGWAVLVAFALFRATRSRTLRWLWWAHPAITVAVVVGTGNHFWLDGIVGTLLFLGGWRLSPHLEHRPGMGNRHHGRALGLPTCPRCPSPRSTSSRVNPSAGTPSPSSTTRTS